MAFRKKSKRNPSDIESELQELRKFKQGVEKRSAASTNVKIFLAKLWAGPELSKSLESWMVAKDSDDAGRTITATANLIAAVLRRMLRVGFVFIFLAAIPIFLIIWQNIIMERQNQSLIKQIEAERAASSNQQVTEYLRLLLSSDEQQVAAAEGFLVSDLVNRDLAVRRLAALIQSGNSEVQCRALTVVSRIIETSADLTLKDAIAPDSKGRAVVTDWQCPEIDFSGVDFGPITFLDVGFPESVFRRSDLSDVEFQASDLRHSDLSEATLCEEKTRCVRFVEDTDLSFSKLRFTNWSRNVFRDGMILRGAQLKFDHDVMRVSRSGDETDRDTQIKNQTLIVPNIPQESLIASGVCYETSFSQCYLYHKAKDLGQLDAQRLSVLRQSNCPINLEGPIVLTAISSCKDLGLRRSW